MQEFAYESVIARPRREEGDEPRVLLRMAIRVECYAGYRGEQEPVAFWLGTRRLAVHAVTDRWFAPSQRWFRVDADDATCTSFGTTNEAAIGKSLRSEGRR